MALLIIFRHVWWKTLPTRLEELKALQEELAQKVRLIPLKKFPHLVGGVDVSYLSPCNLALGVAVVYDLRKKQVIEEASYEDRVPFPYIPGFLSFREVPVLKGAISRLKTLPEVFFVDGQGILHPRGLGLASHLGLEIGLPTVGVAKKPLVGAFEPPPLEAGAFSPIFLNGEIKGFALRSRRGVKPIFVSPGHLIDLPSSLEVVKRCLSGYRLPEPVRLAHLLSQRLRRERGNCSCRGSGEKGGGENP